MKYFIILFFISFFGIAQYGAQDPDRAFPTASGGGAVATGGRTNLATARLIIINTLNPNTGLTEIRSRVWAGGIDAALTSNLGVPRYIVSNVSGQINVGLTPASSSAGRPYGEGIFNEGVGHSNNMTVLGQTAPRGGLTIINGYIHIKRSSNIIMRYVTARPKLLIANPVGDDTRSTGINMPGNHVILDHVSSSFGGDKAIIAMDWFDGYPNQNTTIQRSIMAESATLGFMVDGRNVGEDWSVAGNISANQNLLVGKRHRTFNMGGFNGYGEQLNNVVNWSGSRGVNIVYGSPQINVENNYWKHFGTSQIHNWQDLGNDPLVHVNGNWYDNPNKSQALDGSNTQTEERALWSYFGTSTALPSGFFSNSRINDSSIEYPLDLLTALQARDSVLSDVGNNKYIDDDGYVQVYQDDYDQNIINMAATGVENTSNNTATWTWPTIPSNTRPSGFDTDNDGMADAWEMRVYGSLDEDWYEDFDGDGIPNIEEYANQVDFFPFTEEPDPVEPTPTPTPTPDALKKKKYIID